jgi:hypothetical protein
LKSAPAKYAILFFACVLFHILGTWTLPLIDRDEPRFAEASREMIERVVRQYLADRNTARVQQRTAQGSAAAG